MVLEVIAAFAIMVGMVIGIWVFGMTVIEWLRPAFVQIHFYMPTIGDVKCGDVPVQQQNGGNQTTVGGTYGKPGWNDLGCFVSGSSWYAWYAIGFMIVLSMLAAFVAGSKSIMHGGKADIFPRMLDKGLEAFLLLIVLFLWPHTYDFFAVIIYEGAVQEAAFPWGPVAGDRNLLMQNAQKTIAHVYDATRDPGLGSTDCIQMVDNDKDGYYDSANYNWGCMLGKALSMSPIDWVMAFFLFLFTSFVSISMILMSNVLMILRLLMTAALASQFVFFLVLSRLPLVGKIGQLFVQTMVGLMIAPLVVAGIAVAGSETIQHEALYLNSIHAPDHTVKFVVYVMAIGVIAAMMTGVVMCAGVFAPMLISLSTMIAGGVSQVFANSARAATVLAGSGVGGETGEFITQTGGLGLQLGGYGGGVGGPISGFGGYSDASNREIEMELANAGSGGGYGDEDIGDSASDDFSPGEPSGGDSPATGAPF